MRINVQDWYWIVAGSTTQVYSSARNIYVPTTDAAYVAWLATGKNASTIGSEVDLWFYIQQIQPDWMFNGTTFSQPAAGQFTKAQLTAYSASARYNREVGGTTVNGVAVATDRDSQAMLNGAFNMATQNNAFTTQWKNPDGSFTQLNAATIIAIAVAVGQHVANCFSTEQSVAAQVAAGTMINTTQINAAFAAIA